MFNGNAGTTKAFKKWERQRRWSLTRWEVMDMFDPMDRKYAKEILDFAETENSYLKLGVTHGNYNWKGTDTKFYNMHDVFEIAHLIKWGDGG